jgi:LPXTG-motif cell wall-anchored protein
MRKFNKFNHPLTDGSVKKRYKMYKSKKHWVYSALLFLGTGAVVATSGGIAKADVTTASSEPETSVGSSTKTLTSTATISSEESQTNAEVTTPEEAASTAIDNSITQSAVIQFKDKNGSILKETAISGESGAAITEGLFSNDYQELLNSGYNLVQDGTIDTFFDDNNSVTQTFVITLKQAEVVSATNENATNETTTSENNTDVTTNTTNLVTKESNNSTDNAVTSSEQSDVNQASESSEAKVTTDTSKNEELSQDATIQSPSKTSSVEDQSSALNTETLVQDEKEQAESTSPEGKSVEVPTRDLATTMPSSLAELAKTPAATDLGDGVMPGYTFTVTTADGENKAVDAQGNFVIVSKNSSSKEARPGLKATVNGNFAIGDIIYISTEDYTGYVPDILTSNDNMFSFTPLSADTGLVGYQVTMKQAGNVKIDAYFKSGIDPNADINAFESKLSDGSLIDYGNVTLSKIAAADQSYAILGNSSFEMIKNSSDKQAFNFITNGTAGAGSPLAKEDLSGGRIKANSTDIKRNAAFQYSAGYALKSLFHGYDLIGASDVEITVPNGLEIVADSLKIINTEHITFVSIDATHFKLTVTDQVTQDELNQAWIAGEYTLLDKESVIKSLVDNNAKYAHFSGAVANGSVTVNGVKFDVNGDNSAILPVLTGTGITYDPQFQSYYSHQQDSASFELEEIIAGQQITLSDTTNDRFDNPDKYSVNLFKIANADENAADVRMMGRDASSEKESGRTITSTMTLDTTNGSVGFGEFTVPNLSLNFDQVSITFTTKSGKTETLNSLVPNQVYSLANTTDENDPVISAVLTGVTKNASGDGMSATLKLKIYDETKLDAETLTYSMATTLSDSTGVLATTAKNQYSTLSKKLTNEDFVSVNGVGIGQGSNKYNVGANIALKVYDAVLSNGLGSWSSKNDSVHDWALALDGHTLNSTVAQSEFGDKNPLTMFVESGDGTYITEATVKKAFSEYGDITVTQLADKNGHQVYMVENITKYFDYQRLNSSKLVSQVKGDALPGDTIQSIAVYLAPTSWMNYTNKAVKDLKKLSSLGSGLDDWSAGNIYPYYVPATLGTVIAADAFQNFVSISSGSSSAQISVAIDVDHDNSAEVKVIAFNNGKTDVTDGKVTIAIPDGLHMTGIPTILDVNNKNLTSGITYQDASGQVVTPDATYSNVKSIELTGLVVAMQQGDTILVPIAVDDDQTAGMLKGKVFTITTQAYADANQTSAPLTNAVTATAAREVSQEYQYVLDNGDGTYTIDPEIAAPDLVKGDISETYNATAAFGEVGKIVNNLKIVNYIDGKTKAVIGAPNNIAFTDENGLGSNQLIYIVEEHQTTTVAADATKIEVVFVGAGKNTPTKNTQVINWKLTTDLVTGKTNYVPTPIKTTAVPVPTIAGYTHDAKGTEIPVTQLQNSATKPVDKLTTVTYTPDIQELTITFVDTDDHNTTVSSTKKTGILDETEKYVVDVSDWATKGYELVNSGDSSVDYTFGLDDKDNVEIKLKHIQEEFTPDRPGTYPGTEIKDFTKTDERVIHYTFVNHIPGSETTQTLEAKVDKIFRDKKTGELSYGVWTVTQQAAEVITPLVTGFTADKAKVEGTTLTIPTGTLATEVIKQLAAINDETVVYTGEAHTVSVSYMSVDQETGQSTLIDTISIPGNTGDQININRTPDFVQNYVEITSMNQGIPATLTLENADTAYTLYYQAHLTVTNLPGSEVVKTKAIIHFTGLPQEKAEADQVTEIEWQKSQETVNDVTGKVVDVQYTPKLTDSTDIENVLTVTLPVVPGYLAYRTWGTSVGSGFTQEVTTVQISGMTINTIPTDSEITINYVAQPQSLTVTYLDESTGQTVGNGTTLTGVTDETGTYTATVPANYRLAAGQPAEVPYTFTADDRDNVVIKLDHATEEFTPAHPGTEIGTTADDLTLTNERIIAYQFADQTVAGNPTVQTLTATVDNVARDLVTGALTYGTWTIMQGGAITPTAIVGYTASPTTIAATNVSSTKGATATDLRTALASVKDEVVVYTPTAQTLTITYVDDDNHGTTVGTPALVHGTTGATSTYTAVAPAGYDLAKNQSATVAYQFTTDDTDDFSVHLVHKVHTYTPDNPGTQPGTEIADFTVHDTRTITTHYVDNKVADANLAQPISASVDTITWDEATNLLTYGTWTVNNALAQTVPAVAGYTASASGVAASNVVVHAGMSVAEVTAALTAVADETVTYTPDTQTGSVHYIDDVQGTILLNDSLSGATGTTNTYSATRKIADFVAQGYELVSSDVPDTLVMDDDNAVSQDYTVHLTHQTTTVTPDNPGLPTQPVDETKPNGPKWPVGTDVASLTDTVSHEIVYQFTDGTTAAPTVTQTVDFTRSARVDLVNGQVVYTDWVVKDAGAAEFVAVKSPKVNGYQAAISQTTAFPAVATMKDTSTLVTYTASTQRATVQFLDESGQVLETTAITGLSGSPVDQASVHEGLQNAIDQGYNLDVNGTLNAVFDHDDATDQVFKVTFKAVPVIKITTPVTPVDDNDNPIPNTTPTVVTEVPGTAITPPTIPGYTVKPGQEPKVPETTGEATKIVYTANPQHATVQYLTESGTVLGTTAITGPSDHLVDQASVHEGLQNAINQGYNLDVNGTLNAVFDHDDATNQVFKVTFTAVPVIKITTPVTPVDDKGNPIPNTTPTVVTEVPGTAITPPAIPGYTVKPGQEPKVPETTGEATKIVYTANPQHATVQYLTESGTVLGTTAITGPSDHLVDQASVHEGLQNAIDQGYNLDVNGTLNAVFDHDDATDQVFKVTFKAVPVIKITTPVTPVDDKGNPIPNTTPTVVTEVPGTAITPPTIPGYTVKPGQEPKVPETTGEATKIVYTANTQHATVQYLTESGTVLGTTAITGPSDHLVDQASVHEGLQNAIDQGYNLDVNGTLNAVFDHDDATDQVFKVTFKAVPVIKITTPVTPVDDNGKPIPNTTPTVVTEVPGTAITPPAIPGYTVKPGQEPKVPETTGEATKIVYTANPQTAVIHFVTKEGTVIQVPITVTGVSDGVVGQTEIEAVIQQLTAQGYTLISNTAKNAVFDHDDTDTQAFVVTFANKVMTPSDDKTPAKPNGGADTGTPTVPNTQGNNATPGAGNSNGSGTLTNGVTPTSNETISAATQNTQAARTLLADTNAASKRKLPNTGEEKASGLSILGAIAVGFAGLIGLGKKKKED